MAKQMKASKPPNKRLKENGTNPIGVSELIADMARSIKKANEMGPELHSDLSEVITKQLCYGMDKDADDKVLNNYLTPKNYPRLEVVRVKCQSKIFNKVTKEAKLEDVHSQNIQKPLLKGMIAVSSLLSSLMNEEDAQEVSKQEIVASLKDAISLLTSTSHKIDLRRSAPFKPYIKDDYASLCSEQTPIEGLLFGTELGQQTVKDLIEKRFAFTASPTGENAPLVAKTKDDGMPLIRERRNNLNVSHQVSELIMQSW
eukprot:gene10220-18904_t